MQSLKEKIKKRTQRTVNGCVIWKGTVTTNGALRMYHDGQYINIKQLIYAKAFNCTNDKERRLFALCGDPLCINPEHLREGAYFSATMGVELNKKIFAASLFKGRKHVAYITKSTTANVQKVLTHTVMLPYFQIKLEELAGKAVQDLDDKDLSSLKLSRFAKSFIARGKFYRFVDKERYLELLDKCVIVKDKLDSIDKSVLPEINSLVALM